MALRNSSWRDSLSGSLLLQSDVGGRQPADVFLDPGDELAVDIGGPLWRISGPKDEHTTGYLCHAFQVPGSNSFSVSGLRHDSETKTHKIPVWSPV